MPLNMDRGEVIEGLGNLYRLAPKDKWARTPMFSEARIAAHEAFRRSSGKFVNDDTEPMELTNTNFIVQEYPLTGKLAFLFCATIDGKEYFYPYVFDLPPSLTDQLNVEGMWSYELPSMGASLH